MNGWASPYVGGHLPGYDANRLWYAATGDVVMVVSLFVLGGAFWDKLWSLFAHGATVTFPVSN